MAEHSIRNFKFVKKMPLKEWRRKRQSTRLQRWLNEVAVCKALPHHNHVIALLFHVQDATSQYLFYEHCQGGTLRDYWRRHLPMHHYPLSDMLHQICCGLQWIHEHQLYHQQLSTHHIVLQATHAFPCGYILRLTDLSRCSGTYQYIGSPLVPRSCRVDQRDLQALHRIVQYAEPTWRHDDFTMANWLDFFKTQQSDAALWPATWDHDLYARTYMWLAESHDVFYQMATTMWQLTGPRDEAALAFCQQRVTTTYNAQAVVKLQTKINLLIKRALFYESNLWLTPAYILYQQIMTLVFLLEKEGLNDTTTTTALKHSILKRLAHTRKERNHLCLKAAPADNTVEGVPSS